MTPNQIKLVRETWSNVAPIADTAAEMFYQRLFEIDPSTKPLFSKTDMTRQRGMLLDALGLVVKNAARIENLSPALKELGRRHVRYGVEDHHYDSVGAALLWTLEQGLGDTFTDATRTAWTDVYTYVSSAMRHATADTGEASA